MIHEQLANRDAKMAHSILLTSTYLNSKYLSRANKLFHNKLFQLVRVNKNIEP